MARKNILEDKLDEMADRITKLEEQAFELWLEYEALENAFYDKK